MKRKLEDEEKREEDSVSSGGIGGYGVDTDADNAMQVKNPTKLSWYLRRYSKQFGTRK